MLVSQNPQDSKAPVHLAQVKHETDYKHRLKRRGQIHHLMCTFSYNGGCINSV